MTILVCTDFSAGAAAGELHASRRFPDAELILFHAVDARLAQLVVNATGMDRGELLKEMTRYADARLNEVVQRLGAGGRKVAPELVEGDPVTAALQLAVARRAELIVVGIAAEVDSGRFRTQLVRRSRVPVLLVPAEV